MRKIDEQAIADIAIGASFLGTGGGGDPHIGMLMAQQAVREYGPVTLLDPDEIPDDALILPMGMTGAPTVLVEKPPSGKEGARVFEMMESYLGKKAFGIIPYEVGGVNSMIPLAIAASMGLPLINADGMGRAFPEAQLTTFALDGIKASPLVLVDERGNSVIVNAVDSKWTERIGRNVTVQMGGAVTNSKYPLLGKEVRQSAIAGTLDLSENIGRLIRKSNENKKNTVQELLDFTGGFKLFHGKVIDINRKTESGFGKGITKIMGLQEYQDQILHLHFQNEFLLAEIDGQPKCITPDLICLVDAETGIPITAESLRYGVRCVIMGIPCHPKWRTEKGIQTAGPGYFGFQTDYVPVEELAREGAKKA